MAFDAYWVMPIVHGFAPFPEIVEKARQVVPDARQHYLAVDFVEPPPPDAVVADILLDPSDPGDRGEPGSELMPWSASLPGDLKAS